MKRFRNLINKPWTGYAAALCTAVVLYELLEHIVAVKTAVGAVWTFLSPIVIGVVVAYLFDPVSEFFKRKVLKKVKKDSARHIWGVILTIICVVLILALLLVALIPSVVKSITKLISNWDSYMSKLKDILGWADDFAKKHNLNVDLSNVHNLVDNAVERLFNVVKDNLKNILSTVGSIGSGISNFAIGIVFGFCFLAAKKTLLDILGRVRAALVKKERIEKNNQLLERCHRVFIRYVGATLLDALIVGVATLIFTLAAQMPYAPLIAAVVAITNIIPTFGPMIGAAIGIFFLILESPVKALIFFIFICILQGADGMIIKTKLFKGSLGIPGVWTMVLIILGGKVAGMIGILLAIPAAAIFVILYHETIVPKLEKRSSKINEVPINQEMTETIKEKE
jgi:predicted PurR-regulated permease PerM